VKDTGAQSDPGYSWVGLETFAAGLLLDRESDGEIAKITEAVEARRVTRARLADTDQLGLEANARRGAFTEERVIGFVAEGKFKNVMARIREKSRTVMGL